MTDAFDDQSPVSLTWKSGRDFDAVWLVIRGRSVADVTSQWQAGVDGGHYSTIGKLHRDANAEYALGRGIGATPVESVSASNSAPATGNVAASAALIPYDVPFNKKDEFKKLAGLANVKFSEKRWHLKGDTDASIVAEVDAQFKRVE